MKRRPTIIFIISLCVLVATTNVQAAQFEGTNITLPKDTKSIPEKKPDQAASTQMNTAILNEMPNTKPNITTLDIEIASDVYSAKDRQVLYCPKGNYMVVRNRIYVSGLDLDKVKQVKYLLHPSFSNPVAVSEDPTNDFEVWIWSWGGFPIKATIITKTGQVFEKDFDFSFKSKFEEAQTKEIPQIMRCED